MRALEKLNLNLPRIPLGIWPTPIRQLDKGFWVKDESNSGLLYGGNKVRKLEFLLARAVHRKEKRELITVGAMGSNHVFATAIYGNSMGLRTHAVVFPQPENEHVARNRGAIKKSCASVTHTSNRLTLMPRAVFLAIRLKIETGYWPQWISAGGSEPLGTVGWVLGGLEIAEAVRKGEIPEPDRIFVAIGTFGTAAGILLGVRLGGLSSEVVGVQVVDLPVGAEWLVSRLAKKTLALIKRSMMAGAQHSRLSPSLNGFRVIKSWLGGGYGLQTEKTSLAAQTAQSMGLSLDPTYTAKCFGAAYEEYLQSNRALNVLFINTVNNLKIE